MASGTLFVVSMDVVIRLRNTGLKWVDVANMLSITPKTLRIWRHDNNYDHLSASKAIELNEIKYFDISAG
jgi:uncharacterized protein YjcR